MAVDPFSLFIKMTMLSITIVGFVLKITAQLVASIAGGRAHQAPVMPDPPERTDRRVQADADEAAFQAAEYARQLRAHQQRTGSQS